MSLDDLVREVQRKIGRNILLFQQLEYLLKYMVANARFSGYSSELEGIISTRKEAINKQTMGQLVGQFVENSNPQNKDILNEPDELKEPHLSFDFRIETDEDSYKEKKESLSRLVFERNKLVHHLLPELNPEFFESCKKVERDLDKQADKVRIEIKNVQALAKCLSDGRKKIAEYLCSEEGKKEYLLSFLRQDRLVILLAEIATQLVREDGWVLMNTAGLLVKQHAPDELALLHKGTEHKSLKSLMLKTDMFEFNEEKTKKGGMRVLYRLKDGFELSYA
ncbi:hypothetical protein Q4519_02875 [Motilimonas sp. 1_MG-2023]|uniref:hypothetical protein n=1 Tax=Motilimonas sp. 1_MG-2023 TaxID=3062672 RepID=UPI0026E26358|nr:hypothetical protein [Motilimonas sp. 1_MG-2023]MDO6524619.1 hypothetical protein [Motilimonas sp. 1_MG-2023]